MSICMTTKPYLIDGIVGNSRMLATLTGNGELQSIFWPNIDGGQHVHRLLGGLSVDGAPTVWQDDAAFAHGQAYEAEQNVLVTNSALPSGLGMATVDAVTPGRDLLVRRVTVTNRGARPAEVAYVVYQWLRVDDHPLYNTTLYDEESDSLVHYRRDVFIALGADRELTDFQVAQPEPALQWATGGSMGGGAVMHGGVEAGGTVAHGDVAGAARWSLGVLAPGESVQLTVTWAFGQTIGQVRELLAGARLRGGAALLDEVRTYWTDWLARARPINVPARASGNRTVLPGIPAEAATPEQVEALYKRSLLVFKLLSDEQTGAVIAAPEFDPACTACGGYAFVWGRDAAYITTAMDYAGYHDLAAGFYRWAVGVQEPEGWWMHRHYVSGNWGPSWGLLQIDETGSILYGMAVHAKLHGGEAFARSVWPNVVKAAHYLTSYVDPETGLAAWSFDLLEERNEQITYSSAAVYAGLQAAADLADLVGEPGAAASTGRLRPA
jgi:oligosaccharide amylase